MQVGTLTLTSTETTITEAPVQDEVYYGGQASVEEQFHAEITSAEAEERLNPRPDVITHKGRIALINQTRTPYQAMVEDLLFVRNVLAGADLAYLLVRGNNDGPSLPWTGKTGRNCGLPWWKPAGTSLSTR